MKNRPSPQPSRSFDVRPALRASSNRIPLSQLVHQGQKAVTLLSKARMGELINTAVRELVERERAAAAARAKPAPPPKDEKSAVEQLKELVQEYEETARAKTELETSRQSLLQELDELRREFERQKARAEGPIEDDLD
jgi:hypothetical protein